MKGRFKRIKILVPILMFIHVLLLASVYGYAADNEKIWKEIRIADKGYFSIWCGNNDQLLSGGKLINIHTKEERQIPVNPEYYGCSPDGRYIFSQSALYTGKKCEGLSVYDTATKQVQCLLNTKEKLSFSSRNPSLLSPDGRYLAWNSKGNVRLHGGEILTFIPVLEDKKAIVQNGIEDIAWSPDSKKIFILTGGGPQRLLIYDVSANKSKSFKLVLMNNFYGKRIKLSPAGTRLYIQAILDEERGDNLYALDLTKLDLTKLIAKPKLLRDGVNSFDISSDNLIVFNMVPSPEAYSPYPKAYAGLYLADNRGKVIKRLTSNVFDINPQFSKNGRVIIFMRTTITDASVYVLTKKN